MPQTTQRSITPARRRLLKMMQQAHYGRILNLDVRSGDPVLSPPPRIIRDVKFSGEEDSRREIRGEDFVLKKQVVKLLDHLDRLQSGTIKVLEIKAGLPFCMSLEEPATP